MKKKIIGTIITAGLLLLVSCRPDDGIGPIKMPENANTPTPIVVPTCTPTITPTPDPAKLPTATPTSTPEPTVMPTQAVEPTVEPTATPTAEPTATPTPSPTPTNTPTPTPVPTVTPTPEPTPEPTATPSPTPSPSPSPTPTVNPEPLVANGWQKTISIDENYTIVFPEVFRESAVSRTDRELTLSFFCEENPEITFKIIYTMQQTWEDTKYDILTVGGSVLEDRPEEKRATCLWQLGDRVYHAILLEAQYPQSLLGTAFGEEEWVTGVMQVEFSYPADHRSEYETEQYSYYVVENGEE